MHLDHRVHTGCRICDTMLITCRQWMGCHGHCFEDVWGAIKDAVAKSLVAVQPGLAHHYQTLLPPGHGAHACFELLGGHFIMIMEQCVLMDRELSSCNV